jgi:hypothetical protein
MKKLLPALCAAVVSFFLLTPRAHAAASVAPPQFGPQHYGGLVIVSMVTPTSGATIRYTTDGSDPTANSPIYSSTHQVALTTTTTVKARAFKNGLTPSSVTAATYTVYNVTQLVFEPEHSPLDNNPNVGGGLRIFPERTSPFDNDFRDSVIVTATISPAVPHVEVTFGLFDLDDPSSNAAPVDPNGAAGNDNISDFTGRPAGGGLSASGGWTDKFGRVSVRLTVSRQPGNNFAVTAATDPFYAAALRLRATDGTIIEDSGGIPLTDARARAKRTPMLTVWRRVHIEVDRMANVTGNSVTGVVAGVATDSPRRGLSTIDLGLNLPAPGALGTDGLLNRFEGGTITISINGSSTAFGVLTNTAALTGNDRIIVRGTVPAAAVGKRYRLVDDDEAHGFGDGAAIPFPDTGRLATCFAPAYILPVFDLSNPTPVVPFVLNTPGSAPSDLRSLFRFDNSRYAKQETYWVAYLLGAMQGTVNEDNDPGDLNGDGRPDESGGVALGSVDELGGSGAVIYLEDIVDFAGGKHVATNSNGTGEQDVVVHKIGHLFGAEHVDGGVMSQSSNVFSPQSLSKIRHTLQP